MIINNQIFAEIEEQRNQYRLQQAKEYTKNITNSDKSILYFNELMTDFRKLIPSLRLSENEREILKNVISFYFYKD